LVESIDNDEHTLALARPAQVREALGEGSVSARHHEESRRLYARHCQQQHVVALLDETLAVIGLKSA
jgi:hypothetical protein